MVLRLLRRKMFAPKGGREGRSGSKRTAYSFPLAGVVSLHTPGQKLAGQKNTAWLTGAGPVRRGFDTSPIRLADNGGWCQRFSRDALRHSHGGIRSASGSAHKPR